MSESMGSNTASGLIDYLDSLVSKGRSRPGIVSPLKTAVTKVLEKTEGERWTAVDMTKIELDDVMARFKNLTMGDYNEASYQAYEARVKRALGWYMNFLENPGWFPKERQRTREANNKGSQSDKRIDGQEHDMKNRSVGVTTRSISVASSTEATKSDEIAYPFPLANGETARIFMPKGVTKADIKRLAVFLEALVIEVGD